MAGFVNALFNQMLSTFAGEAVTMSLHSSDPGSTGSNELAGAGYSRQSVTWSAPASGEVSASSDVEFDVPAASTVTHVGFWDATDTWLGSVELQEPEVFVGVGVVELDPITIALNN